MVPARPSRRAWLLAVLWGIGAFAFHSVGNANGLYARYSWFQIAAHYWSSSGLAWVLALSGRRVGLSGPRLVAAVVVLSAVGALGWEAVEYLDVFDHLHFHGVGDFLLDLAADALGVGTVLLLVRRRTPVPTSASIGTAPRHAD